MKLSTLRNVWEQVVEFDLDLTSSPRCSEMDIADTKTKRHLHELAFPKGRLVVVAQN